MASPFSLAIKITLGLLIILCGTTNGQSTSTQMGSRAAGLGYATVTLSDGWSAFNNIAGAGGTKELSFSTAYEARPALSGANRLAIATQIPTKRFTLAAGVFRFGDEVYNEHIVNLGVAHNIGNTSLGIRGNFFQARAEGFGTRTATTLDVGCITRLTPHIVIGAQATNLTQSVWSPEGGRLATKMTAGISFTPSPQILLATEVEKDLDYPVTWRGGFEYALYSKVFFRSGVNLNPNAAYFGIGFRKPHLEAGYALRVQQQVGSAHQASVSIFPFRKS